MKIKCMKDQFNWERTTQRISYLKLTLVSWDIPFRYFRNSTSPHISASTNVKLTTSHTAQHCSVMTEYDTYVNINIDDMNHCASQTKLTTFCSLTPNVARVRQLISTILGHHCWIGQLEAPQLLRWSSDLCKTYIIFKTYPNQEDWYVETKGVLTHFY